MYTVRVYRTIRSSSIIEQQKESKSAGERPHQDKQGRTNNIGTRAGIALCEDQGTPKRRTEHCAETNSYIVTGIRGIERSTRS